MLRRKFLALIVVTGILFSQFIPHANAAGICDWAKFISDVTAAGNPSLPPGVPFTKTWRLQNIGTCTWTTAYSLVYHGGEQMGGPASVNLPRQVAPGEMIDISINLISPLTGGQHDGTWILSNASGVRFGVSPIATLPIWVSIFVVESNMVAYDFVTNAPYAQWKSGAGALPFPGTSGDSRGYVLKLDNPKLEDGSVDPQSGLLTVPQNKFDGYIQATYPEFLVQRGDRLQTAVNCEYGATACYATFRVDYRDSSGAVRTLWQFKEAYEGRVYRANIDLSLLAGQNVKFILMVLATGSASGDRAIWGAPRILRLGSGTPPPPTVTSLPPLTPTQTPFSTPPIISPTTCDKAAFVWDVTVPDGAIFSPNAAFTKTWRLKNAGSCTWTTSYNLVFYSGAQMGAPTSVNFPWSVAPGQTVDLTVNMIAPASQGNYRGFWILRNSSGALFGIGQNATSPFWVEINVSGGTPTEIGYDFWSNACAAQWRSGAGILSCPTRNDADPNGIVIKANYAQLEDGRMLSGTSLLTVPDNRYNGYIQGIYPAFTVQPGDRFHSIVGCEYHANCYVTLRLDYMTAAGSIKTFWTWREKNDGQNYTADVSLTPLVGQSVRFILTVLATGPATGDRVRWAEPYIIRAGVVIPTTIVTPPTIVTPDPAGLIIRGRVTKDGIGLPGVNIYRAFASYSGQLVATTDANGYYQSTFVHIPGDEMVNAWAEQEGYVFDPPNYYWRHYHSVEDRTLNFTASPAPTDDWLGYTNLYYGFKFRYPPRLEYLPSNDYNYQRIDLPFNHSTNLVEKYLEVIVIENASPCQSPLATQSMLQTAEYVTINGISFLKQTGQDGGMSQLREWVAYSTFKNNACISMDFMLHSVYALDPPPPVFDKVAESAVFSQIMSTFAWLDSTPTPSPTSVTNLLPDLTIGGMAIQLQDLTCLKPSGNVLGVRIGIKNQGQAAATSFIVEVNGAQLPVSGLGIGETIALFFPGDRNPVAAVVDVTSAIAESDETNNARTEMVPVSTPPPPCPTFTPSPTPTPTQTPTALIGPYAVTFVAPNDVLNIRSGPGVSNLIIGSFARDAVNVMRTGPSQQADGTEWVEVLLPDGISKGWVNSYYLTEYVSPETFCADTRIQPMITTLKQAMTLSNGPLFGSLVSPKHGLNLNYWPSSDTVNYTSTTAQTAFTDSRLINWGSGGGSGIVDLGTFAQIVPPQMVDVLNSAYQLNCDALSYGRTYTNVWGYTNTSINYYSVVKPPTPGIDFDWKVWLIRIEYVNGQPYLFGAVHYVWEP